MAKQDDEWHDVGGATELAARELQQVRAGKTAIALSCKDGAFFAVSGVCNHAGGPLGNGRLDGDYIECPWHAWKFHRVTGVGEPGSEDDHIPTHELRIVDGRVEINARPATPRQKKPHPPHPLARKPERAPGVMRVLGLSTTAMDLAHPRYSGSDHLLATALARAAERGAETRQIRLAELQFRTCEGYYSKSARACTWPCSITQMDPADQMEQVYEGLVHWCDVVILATPIRWGAASALYHKMAERLNCVQNQITIQDRVLIRNKVAAFIIVGGQDNVQAVAGQALGFFSELGFLFPQFPYVAHSRGWSAEDMENNIATVQSSAELHDGARALVDRAFDLSRHLLQGDLEQTAERTVRGGRKAHRLEIVDDPTA
jgi:multimeric flavodoxin WrbA/nitrite reductase/ring-hydroxylating ferredoxin subunit